MVYCNYDKLQREFTMSFRHKNETETDQEMKERHRNFAHFGRLLRECIECYGTFKKDPDYFLKYITLYHGVNGNFFFSSLDAYIKGPVSTTTDITVAVNFASNDGMIIEFNMLPWECTMEHQLGANLDSCRTINCFDCCWLSAYTAEQEILFIGGLYKLIIKSILEVATAINYGIYIQGIKQMTYSMTNGEEILDGRKERCPNTNEEIQMVFRLLSQRIYTVYPQHQYAQKFCSCPNYVLILLNNHCEHIKRAKFCEEEASKLHELLFKYDNSWIKLDLLLRIFPNIERIEYYAYKKSISFFQESAIYHSLLDHIQKCKSSKLQKIEIIGMNPLFIDDMKSYIGCYKKHFEQYSWKIHLVITHEDKIHTYNNKTNQHAIAFTPGVKESKVHREKRVKLVMENTLLVVKRKHKLNRLASLGMSPDFK
eukprot:362511_1